MNPVLTDDDKPAPAPPRRVSPGLLWAAVLATLVLAIAVVVSFSFKSDRGDVTKISRANEASPLEGGETTHDLPGEQIPGLSFALYDPVTKTFGKQVGSLADYRSAPMVINFWASSCTPCIAEMPALQQVAEQHKDRVAFLGIGPKNDPVDDAVRMIDTTGVTYALGRDNGATLTSWFGLNVLPTTIFVQADGTIADVHTGPLDASELDRILTEKLGV